MGKGPGYPLKKQLLIIISFHLKGVSRRLKRNPRNPTPKGKIPPDFRPYKVKDGEGWRKLAKFHGMEVWELIYQNFKTRNPAEINWYLREYVGCTKKTTDKGRGRNNFPI